MSFRLWGAVKEFFRDVVDPDREAKARVGELVDSVSSWRIKEPGREDDPTAEQAIEGETSDGRTVCITFPSRLSCQEWEEELSSLAAIASMNPDHPGPSQLPVTNHLVRIFVDGQEVEVGGDVWMIRIWHKYHNQALANTNQAAGVAAAEGQFSQDRV